MLDARERPVVIEGAGVLIGCCLSFSETVRRVALQFRSDINESEIGIGLATLLHSRAYILNLFEAIAPSEAHSRV